MWPTEPWTWVHRGWCSQAGTGQMTPVEGSDRGQGLSYTDLEEEMPEEHIRSLAVWSSTQ